MNPTDRAIRTGNDMFDSGLVIWIVIGGVALLGYYIYLQYFG